MSFEELKNFVKDFMNHAGHQYSHVLRVYNSVQKVLKSVEADESVLLPAVILHDIARANEKNFRLDDDSLKKAVDYEESDLGKCHADIGAKWARHYLESIGYDSDKTEKIVYAISCHRFKRGKKPETIEALILQQCDKLDAMGAIGVIRTMIHYPNQHKFYNLEEPIPKIRELNDDDYAIDHFYAKLFKLKDLITIPAIKEEAEKRHNFMLEFVEELNNEVVKRQDGPVHLFLKLLEESVEIPNYDIDNPFKESNNTLVGKMMHYENVPFFKKYIEQLKTEIL